METDKLVTMYLLSGAEKLRGVPGEPRQQDGGEGVEPDQGDRQGESHPVRAAESLSGLPSSHPPPHGSQWAPGARTPAGLPTRRSRLPPPLAPCPGKTENMLFFHGNYHNFATLPIRKHSISICFMSRILAGHTAERTDRGGQKIILLILHGQIVI